MLARYAREFMNSGRPSEGVLERTKLFHTDSVLCGISALACLTNAPSVLKEEALTYSGGKYKARVFGNRKLVMDTRAIASNCSAVRE